MAAASAVALAAASCARKVGEFCIESWAEDCSEPCRACASRSAGDRFAVSICSEINLPRGPFSAEPPGGGRAACAAL
eukprot:scaffold98949_cov66-Phaeocystis_antarctica.AAC.1